MLSRLMSILNVRFHIADLVRASHHSDDFKCTRAGYIARRLKLFSYAFAGLCALWIPFDLVALSEPHVFPIVASRIGLVVFLLGIGSFSTKWEAPYGIHFLLASFVLLLCGFYLFSRAVLGADSAGVVASYSLLPFVYIAALAIFPLTLLEGVLCCSVVVACLFLDLWASDSLLSSGALLSFWLISTLVMITLWAQMGYLHLLMQFYRQAAMDSLTGLSNRYGLISSMKSALSQAESGQDFAILMFDIDGCKRINRTYGQYIGDKVLRCFGGMMKAHLRGADIVGRYAGDKFVALLRNANKEQAHKLAERLRLACERDPVYTHTGESVGFTVNVGVVMGGQGADVEQLLEALDELLYSSKNEGSNRVVLLAEDG
ncbi:GGDEF domain-containing protein [Aestuariirhabdus sp. Z084]|uniref:GGDEF domain-containing protein n=1 Tax=Aestuariirhabdus haliotis TaxID=2918751 RepID=UPI00201B43E8|nr:GGDEF domain-containing protein [Aestuariirhabdus haliotis]MCL6415866.1 GGDEF domain-containing protein [Aestuariirhabdus haliotis]MCL6419832.1 GGDEF domain-containing protein [Aestuariirhabdus haliotis]